MKNRVLSKRYAEALFDELKTAPLKKKVLEEMNLISSMLSTSADFERLVYNPMISVTDKSNVFRKLFKLKKMSEQFLNLTLILIENNRLSLLASIPEYFRSKMIESQGEVLVDVTYAAKPTPTIKKDIEKRLTAITKKKVLINEQIDATLIAGVRIQYGSILYDATVKAALDEMRESFS